MLPYKPHVGMMHFDFFYSLWNDCLNDIYCIYYIIYCINKSFIVCGDFLIFSDSM